MKELPNLTMEYCGGQLVSGDNGEFELYSGITDCATKRNIPYKLLWFAKKNDQTPHHGFRRNGTVKWSELQPYLKDNYTLFLSKCPTDTAEETRDALELRKLKAEIVKLENFNKARSKDFVSRKLVLKTINELVGNTTAVLRRWLEQEQPFKCDGMSAIQLQQINKEILIQVFNDMAKATQDIVECADIKKAQEETNAV